MLNPATPMPFSLNDLFLLSLNVIGFLIVLQVRGIEKRFDEMREFIRDVNDRLNEHVTDYSIHGRR